MRLEKERLRSAAVETQQESAMEIETVIGELTIDR